MTDSNSDAIDAPKAIEGTIQFTYEATLSKGERVSVDQAGGLKEFQEQNYTRMKNFVEDFLTNGSKMLEFSIDIQPRSDGAENGDN